MLTAEDRARLGHQGLDIRVPDTRAHRYAAPFDDEFGYDPRSDEVVDHGGAGLAFQFTNGDHGRHRRRRDRLPALVDDETPVRVAIEGQPDISTRLDDEALQVDEIGRSERVGFVVGKSAVEFEVQRKDRHRPDRIEHRGSGVAGHPVAGVDGDPQWPQSGHIHQ